VKINVTWMILTQEPKMSLSW